MRNNDTVTMTRDRSMVNAFILNVYHWMTIGLAITGLLAYAVSNSPDVQQIIFGNRFVFYGMLLGELGLVFFLSARVGKMQPGTAVAMFLTYAALNGATLAFLFLIYTRASIVSTFFVCSATFGVTSLYGMATKRDLTSVGNFMMMGLFGIIIASLINIFLKNSAMQMIISYIGVFVFVGLTAYDTQKIKIMALTQPADLDSGTIRKGAIMGALTLYLDFINMFIFMLRILGDRR